MATPEEPHASSDSSLNELLAAHSDAVQAAGVQAAHAQQWQDERRALVDALRAAVDHRTTSPAEDFEAGWACAAWWPIIVGMQKLDIRSLKGFQLPSGRAASFAKLVLENGVGPEGSCEQVVAGLRHVLSCMLPQRKRTVGNATGDGGAPLHWQFQTPQDRLPPGDRASGLRDFFYVLRPQLLARFDAAWADRVPEARPVEPRQHEAPVTVPPAGSAPEPQAPVPDDQVSGTRLPAAARRAMDQFALAARVLPGKPTDKEAWDFLKRRPDARDFILPKKFETWSRHVREARHRLDANKNHPRRGRRAQRNITSPDGL